MKRRMFLSFKKLPKPSTQITDTITPW
jgi:hypothetical protein